MNEKQVERKICDFAKTYGITTLKLSGPNARGQADRLFMKDGKTAFIEVKRPGGLPTKLQLKFLAGRVADGFAAGWADTPEKGIEFLTKVFLEDFEI